MSVMKQGRFTKSGDATSSLLSGVDSVALSRLIDEVRNGDEPDRVEITAYNRTYHRHNR